MGLDEEVDEVGPHEPLNFALHVNEAGVGKSFVLQTVSIWEVGRNPVNVPPCASCAA